MSIIRDGFRSLYRSGAFFTEAMLPKALEKTGLPRGRASKAGMLTGGALGLASLVVGASFLIALPMSVPMFSVAVAVYAAKGVAMAGAISATLVGTGIVVTTTALGMCREMERHAAQALKKARGHNRPKPVPPPVPEKTSLGTLNAAPGFNKAVEGLLPAPQAPDPKAPLPSPQPG